MPGDAKERGSLSVGGQEAREGGYGFGPFVLDLERFEVRAAGERLELQPKVFAVLRLLVEAAPRTVPKEELLATVWADVITGDEVLTKAISQARQALSRAAPGQEVIRTVRGRGYGLALPAIAIPAAEGEAAAPAAPTGAPLPHRTPPLLVVGASAGALLALAVAGFVYLAIPAELPYAPPALDAKAAPPATAVAVLAFTDLSPESDHGYLAHGISEDLIAALSRLPELQVAARTSAFAVTDAGIPVPEIGRRLRVGSVVEGSVRVADEHLRVSVQLVRTRDGFHLWGARFDRSLEDGLGVQDDIAAAIAQELEARLAPAVRAPRKPGDRRAFLLNRRARAAVLRRNRAGVREAESLYEQAVALAPESAEAHAGLASVVAYEWGSFSSEPRTSELLERAERHARIAVELDPQSALAHRTLASLRGARHRDWEAARRGFETALSLNPGDGETLAAYAALEMKLGRFDHAMELLKRAVSIDPLSASVHQMLGRLHFYRTEYDAALEALHRSWAIAPGPEVPSLLSKAYGRKGMDRESSEALLLVFSPGTRPFFRVLSRTLGTVGFLRLMMDLVEWRTGSRCGTDPWTGSHVFAYTGETDRMIECLTEAEKRHFWYVRVEPAFDPYRQDPRFVALLEDAGFGETQTSR